MTSLPAATFGMEGRGTLREGSFADLVLFDPAVIEDLATYDDPQRAPAGIDRVFVNGSVALEQGRHTNSGTGRMLRFRRSHHGA